MNIELIDGIAHMPDGTSFELAAALNDCRAEITRLNQAAGETIFNPAATEGLDEVIQKLTA